MTDEEIKRKKEELKMLNGVKPEIRNVGTFRFRKFGATAAYVKFLKYKHLNGKAHVPRDKKVVNEELAEKAHEHQLKILHAFPYLHRDSLENSFYRRNSTNHRGKQRKYWGKVERTGINVEIGFVQESLTEAAFKYTDEMETCIVSASYYDSLGGGFRLGHMTEESKLCWSSDLYSLEASRLFYRQYYKNREVGSKNYGRIMDWLIFFYKVLFERENGEMNRFHVITCCPPHKNSGAMNGISHGEAVDVLEKRINHILRIAEEREITTLIVGDWGCEDKFGYTPVTVAETFRKCLLNRQINRVLFAIEDREKLRVFKYAFGMDDN